MTATALVPLILVSQAIAWAAIASAVRQRRERRASAVAPRVSLKILVHDINEDRCTGCETCIDACPTNVLQLVAHKSSVVRFDDCVQCEKCARVCPTQALAMHREDEEAPPITVPELDAVFQTQVPGQYLIGEVAGKPLVKNAANLGRLVVEHMVGGGLRAGALGAADELVDVLIVGSGPGGLSAALACEHHGLRCVVLEKEQVIASTVSRYPSGKAVMAEPADCRNLSFLPVFDTSKEQLVAIWKELVESSKMNLRLGEAVETVQRAEDGVFDVRTTVASYRAQRVVLATGVRGKPRTLGVPGENLPKVASMLEDATAFTDRDVLVVGGGDSALEAACTMADAGARVVLSYRKKSFSRAKKPNVQRVEELLASGNLQVFYKSQVKEIREAAVALTLADGTVHETANDACFILIGADLPVKWLGKVGVSFVERPHSYSVGSSDALVSGITKVATDCPITARDALALVRGETLRAPRIESAARLAFAEKPGALRSTASRRPQQRRASTIGSVMTRLRRAATNTYLRARDRSSVSKVKTSAIRHVGRELDVDDGVTAKFATPNFDRPRTRANSATRVARIAKRPSRDMLGQRSLRAPDDSKTRQLRPIHGGSHDFEGDATRVDALPSFLFNADYRPIDAA